MAQRVILTDDLDGSPADTTLRFSIDTTAYEIDLSDAHARQFCDLLEPSPGCPTTWPGR
jgi:hypothetical protein